MPQRKWSVVLILLFVAGLALQNPWLAAAPVMIFCLAVLIISWNKQSLKNVTYSRKWRYRAGFPGESFSIRIEVENKKILPLSWFRVRDYWPLNAAPENVDNLAPSHIADKGILINLYTLKWFEKITRDYHVHLEKRGYYEVGPSRLESGDLFGVMTSVVEQPELEHITVYPEVFPIEKFYLPTDDPFGDRKALRRLFDDPIQPIGIRDYHPEDDFRRVHWPATARTGQLQVKVYQPVRERVIVICFNVNTSPQAWMGIDHDLFEYVVKLSASLVVEATELNYSVGLMSNGYLADADRTFYIAPGRSKNQLPNLLKALAAVTPFTTTTFETFLSKNTSKLPYGATLLVITPLVTDELIELLIRLKQYRSHISLFTVGGKTLFEIPGITITHIPFEK